VRRQGGAAAIPAPFNIGVKTAEIPADNQGQVENRKNGFETPRGSNSGRFGSDPAVSTFK